MELEIRQTGPMPVNTYILKDKESKEAVLIDVGGSFEEIKADLEKDGYTVKFILNTHGHFDHVLGEVEVQEKYPEIPIYMHEGDTSHFEKIKEEMNLFGFSCHCDSIKTPNFIDESSELYIGKNRIGIFYTPGHSKGGMSFYVDGKLFSGDALFFHSIGRTDFYDADYDTLINSIKTKLFTLPDDTVVYPGHGPDTTIGKEKRFNMCIN